MFEACRLAIRHEATPAVLRLYNLINLRGRMAAMAKKRLCSCSMRVIGALSTPPLRPSMSFFVKWWLAVEHDRVEHWLEYRIIITALQGLTKRGFVIDTMEVTAPWSKLDAVYQAVRDAALSTPHAVSASFIFAQPFDGACLYFSLASRPPRDTPFPE